MNYKNANDLVKWCLMQKDMPNQYVLGGIGRIKDEVRSFDCIGMIKCFLWHDYSSSNAVYYNKTAPDTNCEGFFALASEKGTIDTIPEIKGLIVYMKGHVGVYLGNGQVVESTARWEKKIVVSYFKGNHPDTNYKRCEWTHWFKLPQLNYDEEVELNDIEDNAKQWGLKVAGSLEEGQKFYLSKYATIYGGSDLGLEIPSRIKNNQCAYTAGNSMIQVYEGRQIQFVLAKEINSFVRVDECMIK